MMTGANKRGRCACGKVGFTAALPSDKVVLCHCPQCKQRTGSAFGIMVYFPEENLQFSKEFLQIYDYLADSGNKMQSHFCQQCGTSLFLTGTINQGLVGVAGGCFDDVRFWYGIDREIFCRSKAPFVEVDADVSLETSPRYGSVKPPI